MGHVSNCPTHSTTYEERETPEQRPLIEAEPVCRTLPNRNRRRVYSSFFARDAQVLFDRRFARRKQTGALVTQDCRSKSICALCSVRLVEQLRRRDAGLRLRREQAE